MCKLFDVLRVERPMLIMFSLGNQVSLSLVSGHFPLFLRFLFCFVMGRAQYFSGLISDQDDSLDHPTVPCVRRVNKEIQI